MKRLAVLPIVVVLALATVVTALAAGPVRFPFEYEVTYPVADCADFGVGDFVILNNEVGSGVDKFWFDDEGNVFRWKWHVAGVDHLFVDGYPENVVTGHFHVNGDFYFDPAVLDPFSSVPTNEHLAGIAWNIQLPGYGAVYHLAGTVFYENGEFVREAGIREADFVALCQYFAP